MLGYYPLYIIEWLDHTEDGPDWQQGDPSDDMHITHCFSVGWIVGEDENVVKLVPHLYLDDDEAGFSSALRIAKGAILRRISLPQEKNDINFEPRE